MSFRIRCLGIAVAVLVGASMTSGAPIAAQSRSINQRKAVAQAVITGSRGRYDGSFASSGTAGVCGEIPKEASITGTASFVVEFPSDGTGKEPINAIAFGSNQLVGGVTTASVFRLMITVVTPKGARPPAYVLNTDSKGGKSVGTATVRTKGTETTLNVTGQNELGEAIDLTVTCS